MLRKLSIVAAQTTARFQGDWGRGQMYGSWEVGIGLLTVSVAVAACSIGYCNEDVLFSVLTSGSGFLVAMSCYSLSRWPASLDEVTRGEPDGSMYDRHSTISRTHAAQTQQRINTLPRSIADREQRGENVESKRKLLRIVEAGQRQTRVVARKHR
jgi:hypothetical protein